MKRLKRLQGAIDGWCAWLDIREYVAAQLALGEDDHLDVPKAADWIGN